MLEITGASRVERALPLGHRNACLGRPPGALEDYELTLASVDDCGSLGPGARDARRSSEAPVTGRAEPLDRGTVASRSGPDEAKPGQRSELQSRGAHPAGRAVHEDRLAGLHPRRTVKHLVRGHIREDELATSAGSRSSGTSTAYASGTQTRSASAPHTVSAPTRSPSRSLEQPGPSSSTTADELVAGRERRLRAAEVRPGAYERVGERHPGRQDPDADLARTRSGIVLLHHPQDLGPAELVDDDTLHRLSLDAPHR